MVINFIDHMGQYAPLHKELANAISVMQTAVHLDPGKYDTDYGYFVVQKGFTRPIQEVLFETHEEYIDIQYLYSGEEVIYWNQRDNLEIKVPYDQYEDLTRYMGVGHKIAITEGMCYVLLPTDAHKACCHSFKSTWFHKIIYKLKIK